MYTYYRGEHIVRRFSYKIFGFMMLMAVICQSLAFAASKPVNITAVRSSIAPDKVRIVFQLDNLPDYQVTTDKSGQNIIMNFSGTNASAVQNNININDDIVKSVKIANTQSGCSASIALSQAAPYKVITLQNQTRIFIDIQRYYEHSVTRNIEKGLDYTAYDRRNADGVLKAYILNIDPAQFSFMPVLGGGRTPGRNTVSNMAGYYNAIAAVNASYFGGQNEVYGLTEIDGTIATTTYLPRTAFGIDNTGKPIIATVNYNGSIHTKKGDFPIGGVNCVRAANTIIEYNSFYGDSTGTNEYGTEYVVENNKIIKINTNDTPLKNGQAVISAQGTMKDSLNGLKVGDEMTINEDIGDVWKNALEIVGVGPCLVKNGQADITSDDEQIGPDVTGGLNPRTAAAIKNDGHVLLVVVDGRQAQSDGLSLNGMAKFLISLGAKDAVNFDGGGSSEMVLNGQVLNSPSDGMERPVGVALSVIRKNSK